jgi:hypothetical protein
MKPTIFLKVVFFSLVGIIMILPNALQGSQEVLRDIETIQIDIHNLQKEFIAIKNTKGRDTKAFDLITGQLRIKLSDLNSTLKQFNESDPLVKDQLNQKLARTISILKSLEKARAQSQWREVDNDLQQLNKSIRDLHSVAANKPGKLEPTVPAPPEPTVSQPPPPTGTLPAGTPPTVATKIQTPSKRTPPIPSTVLNPTDPRFAAAPEPPVPPEDPPDPPDPPDDAVSWIADAQTDGAIEPSVLSASIQSPTAAKLKVPLQQKSLPDLYVSEFSLKPSPPSRSEVVEVAIGVYNQGSANAGAFTVEWWPGENYRAPGCTWRIESLAARGGRILKCSGYVFPSRYSRIRTVVKVDPSEEVNEQDEGNNTRTEEIQVLN